MNTVFAISAILLGLSILLALVRLAQGPTTVDRVIAFDTISICVIGMIVLICFNWKTTLFLELILILSSLGFFSTVAYVLYLTKKFHQIKNTNSQFDSNKTDSSQNIPHS